MSRRVTVILISLVSILTVLSLYFGFYGREDREINVKTNAASGSATLTSQADWEAGTLDNVDSTTTPGSVEIDDKSLGNKIEITEDMITILSPIEDAVNVIDSDWDTYWQGGPESYGTENFITLDLGEIRSINKIVSKYTIANNSAPYGISNFFGSTNGIDYECFEFGDFGNIEYVDYETLTHTYDPAVEYRFFRMSSPEVSDCDDNPEWGCSSRLYEIELYEGATATHTSASTQLDSGVCDSSEWTTFVPDDTIPANTSIEYRFRTSDDAATWGDWTASTPSAASIDISTLLGATDAAKRYLQVESTLANTDGVSTPTIAAYTANYECTNTCDDFDHLDISPASITIDSGESTTITATPKDAADQTLEGITVSYSADCGSVDSNGVFTAPTVSEDTTCTVTATSECGGSETSTVTINVPDDPPPPGGCNNNGIQDNGETGVDCGGGGCADCPITPEPPPPNPPGGCTNFSHLSISPSSLSICANDSAVITYYGVDTFGNIMSGLSEFLVVETGTLVGNRYTAPSEPGSYTMAASSICGNANGTITVRSCLPSPPPSPPPGPPPPGPPPGPPPPNCVGPDCECEGDICWCIGEDCTCSDPETCLPCVGEDCVCDPERMVCHCEGDECVCNDPDKCEGPEPVPPLPICIGSGCINIDPKIIEVAGSVSTGALGLAALIASLLLLAEGLAKVLTMIKPSQLWAYLIKGRDRKHARGIAYDADSGIGIPLTKVLLFRSRDRKLIRVATSGSDGRFALETPPGEEYYLEIRKEGYETLSKTQAELSNSALAYDNNYQGETFRTDQAHLLFDKAVPLSANAESTKLALSARVFETITKVLRVINIPLLIFGFMMSTLAMIESKTPYNLVIFCLYLLIFAYYLIKLFIIDGRSFGVVTNQAKKDTVDLAIVRAISETRGKLAKTTVTNEKGRYTLVLPKGFYKIIVSKPGLKQKGNLSVRVKSNLRPRTEKIEMIEVRVKTNSSIEYQNSKQTLDSNNLRPTLVTPPLAPSFQPTTSGSLRSTSTFHTTNSQPPNSKSVRHFSGSGEIVEKYSGEIKEIGKSESVKLSDEKPDHDVPNWKFT